MRRMDGIVAVIVGAISAYLMWKSTELPIGWRQDYGPGGGAFPFWLSAGMLLCSLLILVRWWRRVDPESPSDAPVLFHRQGGADGDDCLDQRHLPVRRDDPAGGGRVRRGAAVHNLLHAIPG